MFSGFYILKGVLRQIHQILNPRKLATNYHLIMRRCAVVRSDYNNRRFHKASLSPPFVATFHSQKCHSKEEKIKSITNSCQHVWSSQRRTVTEIKRNALIWSYCGCGWWKTSVTWIGGSQGEVIVLDEYSRRIHREYSRGYVKSSWLKHSGFTHFIL